jgi:hypothetical protein
VCHFDQNVSGLLRLLTVLVDFWRYVRLSAIRVAFAEHHPLYGKVVKPDKKYACNDIKRLVGPYQADSSQLNKMASLRFAETIRAQYEKYLKYLERAKTKENAAHFEQLPFLLSLQPKARADGELDPEWSLVRHAPGFTLCNAIRDRLFLPHAVIPPHLLARQTEANDKYWTELTRSVRGDACDARRAAQLSQWFLINVMCCFALLPFLST